ncbi:LysR substrate-binding domain-containing protein [Streptomyces sp. NPDC001455]|uniref:LysR family transcriptional regulator n=1 Tax=unclassified Streptomyces TaxID=2593676 RepID=UPI0033255E44
MELRQLEYFVAVAEELNFTRAAARLHVAQPSVSNQIRQLERELKQDLLDRSRRAVRLTEFGEAVLKQARAALASVDVLHQMADDYTGLIRGHVSLGMVTSSATAYGLPQLLADFHAAHPGVEMTLAEATSDQLIDALRRGHFDAVAISPPTPVLPGIETLTVADERLVVAVRPGHPLAARASIRLAELRDAPIITFHRSVGARATVEESCAAAGFSPRIAFEASDPNMLAELAISGLGVAILPEPFALARPAALRMLTVMDPPMRGYIVFAWREGGPSGSAARALVRHLRRAMAARPS